MATIRFFHLRCGRGGRTPAAIMTKDDMQLLYEYNRWANNRVFHAASGLSVAEFTRNLGGSFGSVRDTLVHIVGGEWIWLEYWKEPPDSPDSLADLMARRNVLFHPDAFASVAAVHSRWTEVEKQQTEFVNQLTDELLEALLPFRATQVRLMHLMQHLTNHSTYHRGQVALMMRLLKTQPSATDFHVFLVEGRHEAAAAQ